MNKSVSIPTFKPGDPAYLDLGNGYHVQGTVEDVEPGRRKLTWKVDKPAAPNSPAMPHVFTLRRNDRWVPAGVCWRNTGQLRPGKGKPRPW